MPAWVTDFTGLAALISAISAALAARNSSKTKRELTPNHGSSTRDLITQIDSKVNSLGHQVGEIRTDANLWHTDLSERIRRLENKRK